ncbi:MAG: 23S rRNA (adenine(2030)-N(6))-methyltransferase RlmJ [Janthinobacterium lividum]
MNYRHAFHAGNAADCVKHALLVWLAGAMRRKPAGFVAIDTHAGTGRTDLAGEAAGRTGEWRAGIGRLWPEPPEVLREYVSLALPEGVPGEGEAGARPYLGSPALLRALLRPQDRLVCCELHPDDHAALRRLFRGDGQVAVHLRDGHEALRAFLPPPERRALVVIDPPFEAPGEFARLAATLAGAHARFPGGVLAAWYPIKHRAPVRAFHAAVREGGMRDVVAAELWLREPTDPGRLNGSGLLVVNPPWRFEEEAGGVLAALLGRLGEGEAGQGCGVVRLVDE